jgi:hypothetical protein
MKYKALAMSDSNLAVMREGQYSNESKGLIALMGKG